MLFENLHLKTSFKTIYSNLIERCTILALVDSDDDNSFLRVVFVFRKDMQDNSIFENIIYNII
jgi:hypothetical protein